MTGPARPPGRWPAPPEPSADEVEVARPGRLRPGHRCGMSGARDLAYLCRELKAPVAAGRGRTPGRAGPSRRLEPRGLPRRLPRAGGVRPPVPRRRGPHPLPPASRPARPSRTSTSSTSAASARTSSPTSVPSTSSRPRSNAVFLGPPGTGKSHLSIALGIRACLAGHRVAFATAARVGGPPRRRPRRRQAAGRAAPARAGSRSS